MLRVAKEGIISFPNLGKLSHRLQLGILGQMPKDRTLPFEWYNTPNIHLFTLKDFIDLCNIENIEVKSIICKGKNILEQSLLAIGLKNLGASNVIVHIARKEN
jgi:homoserine O-acetyltransferase